MVEQKDKRTLSPTERVLTLDHLRSFISERDKLPPCISQTKFLTDRPTVNLLSGSLLGSPPKLAGPRPRSEVETYPARESQALAGTGPGAGVQVARIYTQYH